MREITGRHVLFFTVGAFGVIIAVNLVMAFKAISTFPGLEVQQLLCRQPGIRRPPRGARGAGLDGRRTATNAAGSGWSITDAAGHSGRGGHADGADRAPDRGARRYPPRVHLRRRASIEAEVPLARGKWMLKLEATRKGWHHVRAALRPDGDGLSHDAGGTGTAGGNGIGRLLGLSGLRGGPFGRTHRAAVGQRPTRGSCCRCRRRIARPASRRSRAMLNGYPGVQVRPGEPDDEAGLGRCRAAGHRRPR